MRYIRKYIIPCLIPILTIAYGSGDYAGWWDALRGRNNAIAGLDKLLNGDGYPESFIYHDEVEYAALVRIINRRTRNTKLRVTLDDGYKPTFISIDGTLAQKEEVPEDFPQSTFVSESAYILYFFMESPKSNKGKATWACSARDLRLWIDEDRNQERFIVSNIFMSIITIWIAVVGVIRKSKNSSAQ